jgi:hypothetical protein
MSTLHEGQYTFVIISPSILLRIKNFSDESCRGNKTHIFCLLIFFRKSFCCWDYVAEYCRAIQTTGHNMAHEEWMLEN